MSLPLDGIRVLDLGSVGPAARASRILADYGADVIKVGAVPRAGSVQITPHSPRIPWRMETWPVLAA